MSCKSHIITSKMPLLISLGVSINAFPSDVQMVKSLLLWDIMHFYGGPLSRTQHSLILMTGRIKFGPNPMYPKTSTWPYGYRYNNPNSRRNYVLICARS